MQALSRAAFRLLYFVIPFSIAISIMGTRKFWLKRGGALAGTAQDDRQLQLRAGRRREPAGANNPATKGKPVAATATVVHPVKRFQSKA